MNVPPADEIEALTAAILASAKYRHLAPSLVRRVTERAWLAHPQRKAAEQFARRKLHQVAGAYWPQAPHYARWLTALGEIAEDGLEAQRSVCRSILASHTSTRERLTILPELYHTCLADLAPVHSVLDIACGLNPLAAPWMPLAHGARYLAYDVYTDLAAFLQQALGTLDLEASAQAVDVLSELPPEPAQVALLMKALPCLEQLDAPAAVALLDYLPAEHLLVSFPARSLGGAQRGMPANYEAHFRELVAGKPWRVQRYAWPSELVFRVDKG